MERKATIAEARKIMGVNFIGVDELKSISNYLPVCLDVVPEIQYSFEELNTKKNDYILILGASVFCDSQQINLINLRRIFGVDPSVSEPCFYNQDWYLNEDFVCKSLENRWYLIKKTVFEESRAVAPTELEKMYSFPSAILCAYTFFCYWFLNNEILWKYDFVWCNDIDHNADRIYVGKYCDIDGVNKNGFSIHRHLALRSSYASVTCK